MRRPLLLGLDNPHGDHPGAALLPRPKSGAGGRLFAMAGMPWSRYNRVFQRLNIVDIDAHSSAWEREDYYRDRTVVVCGKEAWRRLAWLGLPRSNFFTSSRMERLCSRFVLIPHPSGRCREYNDPTVVARTRRLLRGLSGRYLKSGG